MEPIKLFDTVALTVDIPEQGLRRGNIGAVVEVYDDTHFEVEFVDKDGYTYGLAALAANQLMLLHEEPVASK
jgi:hypothetical protein